MFVSAALWGWGQPYRKEKARLQNAGIPLADVPRADWEAPDWVVLGFWLGLAGFVGTSYALVWVLLVRALTALAK